ncbi:MAG: 50S ribosomal protein L3 [Acidobacteriia bacterium]|nr:50S ribosomal protein L3 [Terriglobia bacterium]
MVNGILGIKIGMTQLFLEGGTVVPATVIQAGPCVVIQKKTTDMEGYSSVQLGLIEPTVPKKINKPLSGHLEKAKAPPIRYLKEFKLLDSSEDTKVGNKVLVDQFSDKDEVNVTGISKGKGFAGVMKRHGFSGGVASHGSMFHRAPGSIGQSAYPSRVFKGTRSPGHMGASRVTVKNLKVVKVDPVKNLLIVKGSVPGANGDYLIIRKKNPSQ